MGDSGVHNVANGDEQVSQLWRIVGAVKSLGGIGRGRIRDQDLAIGEHVRAEVNPLGQVGRGLQDVILIDGTAQLELNLAINQASKQSQAGAGAGADREQTRVQTNGLGAQARCVGYYRIGDLQEHRALRRGRRDCELKIHQRPRSQESIAQRVEDDAQHSIGRLA